MSSFGSTKRKKRTIYLSENDEVAIERIRSTTHLATAASAIRYAIHDLIRRHSNAQNPVSARDKMIEATEAMMEYCESIGLLSDHDRHAVFGHCQRVKAAIKELKQ